MRHLQAAGWLLTNEPGDWSWRREMSPDELKEALRSSLRFPLLMAPKPPRRRDDAEMARYHAAVAGNVVRQLVEGGWSLARTLAKKPSTPRHSTSHFIGKGD